MIELILGGARSGKSRHATVRASNSGLPVTLIATAQALDAEMTARIAQHQRERPPQWRTLEAPLRLAETLAETACDGHCVLVDCLTLWLSNQMLLPAADEAAVMRVCDQLAATVGQATGELLLVSNEVGLGLVPETPLGRAFRDAQGRLNQALAQIADRVVFVAAGLPLVLKG